MSSPLRPFAAVVGLGSLTLVGALGAVLWTGPSPTAGVLGPTQPGPASTVVAAQASGVRGAYHRGAVEFVCPPSLQPEGRVGTIQRAYTDYMGCSGDSVPGRAENARTVVMFGAVPTTALLPGAPPEEAAPTFVEDLARRLTTGLRGVEVARVDPVTVAGQPATSVELVLHVDDAGQRTDIARGWLIDIDGQDYVLFTRTPDGAPPLEAAAAGTAIAGIAVR